MSSTRADLPLFMITHAVTDWTADSTDVALLDEPRSYGTVRLRPSKGIRFRMFDADGNLYYRGTMYGSTHSEASAFAPLDWGMADSGCTRIEYYEPGPDGRLGWQVL